MTLTNEELTTLIAKLKEQIDIQGHALDVLGAWVKAEGIRLDALEDKLFDRHLITETPSVQTPNQKEKT